MIMFIWAIDADLFPIPYRRVYVECGYFWPRIGQLDRDGYTHSWSNVSTGEHCFKTEVLQQRNHHGVNATHGSGYANGRIFTTHVVGKEEDDDEGFVNIR